MEIDTEKEIYKITEFIKNTLKKKKFNKVILGLSGGIDSTTTLYLLKNSVDPKNITVAYLYYFKPETKKIENILKGTGIPLRNLYIFSIKELADKFFNDLEINPKQDQIRAGNIMARIRMIILYDLSKKQNALVCGTENKSENYLGYFTRFGDEASDFEPLIHLYKTQVYQLAKALNVSQEIMDQKPTAGLWKNQTDENEFGFSYKEADQVLDLYFTQKLSIAEIKKKGFKNADKIISFSKNNSYKHDVPYKIIK